ncbi:MAG: ABC transporter permease [Planctomycetes bacterium]|nr:ABC transporter permease [Planctomycetota bacterium]
MTLLLGALTVGLILALVALGVLISFRIFRFPDITAEGSVTLGAAVAAALLLRGANPLVAVAAAGLAGALAGSVTGVLHTRCGINNLLAGILVMTALYSVNLHVLGRSNVALLRVTTLTTWSEGVAQAWLGGGAGGIDLLGWEVASRDLGALLFAGLIAAATAGALYLFFRTDLGTAMRATGDNPQMIRAQGGNAENLIVLGLALSNGLIATAGALLAQQQGFADVQMGIGMLVWGLASVIIGEALVGSRRLGLTLAGAVMGSVLFRLLVAIALRWGMDPNDLKLVTAGFVFVALVLPGAVAKLRRRRAAPGGSHA